MIKTYSQSQKEVTRKWLLIDAKDQRLGRLATVVAGYLTGKHKPSYTPHIDGGDHVVVINSDQLVVTGNKLLSKKYYRHSGHPGALKTTSLEHKMNENSDKVVQLAVKGMLPKNKLATQRLARLRVFKDLEHEHTAQNPEKVEVK